MSERVDTPPFRPIATPRFHVLDGMRGIAAVMVVLFHADLDIFANAFERGDSCVDLFFLLSGFVLTLAFEPRFRSGMGAEAFLRLRLRRFIPMTILGAALGSLAYAPTSPPIGLAVSVVCAALMVPSLTQATLYPVNPPQWSLLLELIANAAHALCLQHLSRKGLAVFAAGCGAIYIACTQLPSDLPQGTMSGLDVMLLARTGWSYTLGVVFARTWQARIQAGRAPRYQLDWRLALLLPFLTILAAAWLPVSVTLSNAFSILVLFPALFWCAVNARAPSAIGAKVLHGLGAISFPLYATHFPILVIAVEIGGKDARGQGVLAAVLLAAASASLQPHLKGRLLLLPRAIRT